MSAFDPKRAFAELQWLKDHPHFEQMPASMPEFLGPDYLNIAKGVRPGVKAELIELFGEEVNGSRIAVYRWAMFTGAIGIGKQLRPEELVLTPEGWVRNDSLVPGDFVVGSNGRPTKVTHVFDHEDVQMYRVTFKDGVWVDAGGEHLWQVSWKSSYGKFKTDVVDTEWLSAQKLRGSGGDYKFRIPIVFPVEFEQGDPLPIKPWALGALIANGGMTQRSISYSTEDDWNACKLEDELRANRVHLSGQGNLKYTICDNSSLRRKNSNPVMLILDKLGLVGKGSREKFIPEQYLRASIKDRWSLLRGLMDNDGSAFGKNTQVYSTSSKQLSLDVAELVRSLGGYCTVTEFDRNEAVEYQVHVNMDQECPFSLPRKVANWSPRTNQRPVRSIVSVEKVGRGPGRCIKVDAPDSLYVTKDYIVTHNTTMASIILPYMCHWTLCLKDPQEFYDLLPGSRIAFMQMSTSEDQAKETVFGDIKARVEHSPWFQRNYPMDPKFQNQIRFPKDIWVLPGNSAETTFEGYNILGGILDEADSHKVTKDKDYAEQGWDTINSRIDSRFQDRGFLLTVGQMKKANGFAKKKYDELLADTENAHTVRMTIWESLGWEKYLDENGERDSFWYDIKRKEVIPKGIGAVLATDSENLMEVPNTYRKNFENNPEKALRDLAGIPPATGDPFISLTYKLDEAVERWKARYTDPDTGECLGSPVDDNPVRPKFADWFKANNSMRRAVHLDIAYSAEGDALGLAMGHVAEIIDYDGEKKPYIVFDFLLRMKAAPGTEILLQDVRRVIYDLKEEFGFRIGRVSMDGFQSTEMRQQLNKRKFPTEYVSVDRSKLPYEDLRDAIYEDRIEFPEYMTYLDKGAAKKVQIATKELMELEDKGLKIDHPVNGSKDVADAMAGVVFTLMGDRSYRRSVRSSRDLETVGSVDVAPRGYSVGRHHLPGVGAGGLAAPIPPTGSPGLNGYGLPVPPRLMPRGR